MKIPYLVIPIVMMASQSWAGSAWETMGLEDGLSGKEMKNVASLSDTSESDTLLYLKGYRQGLEQFCNAETATNMGTLGDEYQGVCKHTANSWKFQKAYDAAYVEFKKVKLIQHWIELGNKNWY